MEAVQGLCTRVGKPVNLYPYMERRPGFASGVVEGVLPGGKGNQYALGGSLRTRYAIDSTSMRDIWASACEASTEDLFFRPDGPFPLLFLGNEGKVGALTAQLKSCYLPEVPEKARVALDLDGVDSSKPFPTFQEIVAACRSMMRDHTTSGNAIDWDTEPVIVLMLSTLAKNRSAHVFFPNLSFGKKLENVLGKAHPLTATFNTLLEPLGLSGDFSICNSGLRWAFGDKFPPNENVGRGVVSVPFFDGIDTDLLTYEDLGAMLDPHALPDDTAYVREIDWVLPDDVRPLRRRAVARAEAHLPAMVVSSNASTVEQRICQAIPELDGISFKRYQVPGGVVKLIPQSTFCPFKAVASTDCPAHQHSAAKLYIFCQPNGTCRVKCGVCSDASMTIEAPAVENAQVMDYFNTRYARLEGDDKILVMPQFDAHGLATPMNVISYSAFKNMTADPTKKKVGAEGRKKVPQYQYWYHHKDARRFSRLDFDPSNTLPSSIYNTYMGLNRDVMEVAESMSDFSLEQLAAEFVNTANLIRKNICSDDTATFSAFVDFFADMVVNPGRKPNWAICMFGPQGCGKGLTAQFFLKLVGKPHGIHGDAKSISSEWNSGIVQALLLFADEGTPEKDVKALNNIKKLVTEVEMTARQKYVTDRQVDTVMRILVASNDDAVVIENRDRRWMCCNAKYTLGDENSAEFKALIAKVVQERESLRGPAAFYLMAQRTPRAEGFNINKPINTPARWELKNQNMSPFEQYIYAVCMSGALSAGPIDMTRISKNQRVGYMEVATLRDIEPSEMGMVGVFAYDDKLPLSLWWAGFQQQFPRVPNGITESSFMRWLYSVFSKTTLQMLKNSNPNGWHSFRLPTLDTIKEDFAAYLGQPNDKIYTEWAVE